MIRLPPTTILPLLLALWWHSVFVPSGSLAFRTCASIRSSTLLSNLTPFTAAAATATAGVERSVAALRIQLFSSSPSQSLDQHNNDQGGGSSIMSGQPQQPQLVISLRQHLLGEPGTAAAAANINGNNNKIKLILASQSPRRQEILSMMGLEGLFSVQPSPLDESALQQQLLQGTRTTDPLEYTRTLATAKAMALARSLLLESINEENTNTVLVLGSDTIVVVDHNEDDNKDHTILEKPVNAADATRMLQTLQGRQHAVHTSVALVAIHASNNNKDDDEPILLESFTETAHVTFAALTSADIAAYVATGEPMDKAGAYGIQGVGGQIVTGIQGDFFTVMGLPMHRTSQALAAAITSLRS